MERTPRKDCLIGRQPIAICRELFNTASAFVDFARLTRIIAPVHTRLAEETGRLAASTIGAEGATAPEPLRQKDRRLMALWKAAG